MSPRRRAGALLLLAVLAALLFGACRRHQASQDATEEEVLFEVDPAHLGTPYANREIGLRFRPPVDWEPLDQAQKELVARALLARQEQGPFVQRIIELFLDTSTMSYASIAVVTAADGSPADPDGYADALAEAISADAAAHASLPGAGVAARFSVGGVPVTQFRHILADRVTFILLLTSPEGGLVQLDYSIPIPAYTAESRKLESSIGTISRP